MPPCDMGVCSTPRWTCTPWNDFMHTSKQHTPTVGLDRDLRIHEWVPYVKVNRRHASDMAGQHDRHNLGMQHVAQRVSLVRSRDFVSFFSSFLLVCRHFPAGVAQLNASQRRAEKHTDTQTDEGRDTSDQALRSDVWYALWVIVALF